jgi:HEAT repeat protein
VHIAIQSVLLPLMLCSLSVLLALILLVTWQKAARNRRELRSARRRALILAALERGDPEELQTWVGDATVSRGTRQDLARCLLATTPRHDVAGWLRSSARARGLEHQLLANLRSGDAVLRGTAAELLSTLGFRDRVAELSGLLADPDVDVRHTAVRSLGRLASDEAAWALIGALRDEVLPADRILEHLGRPYAAHALAHAFYVVELRAIRGDLADALGLSGAAPAVYALASLIRAGSERERIKTCRALGRIAMAEAVPLLLEALEDTVSTVRSQAAKALRDIGSADAVGALELALSDEDWWVRANAADALRASGPPGMLALERATRSPDGFARDRAREALALVAAVRERPDIAAAA